MNKNKNLDQFFDQGFSKNLLVRRAGLEPARPLRPRDFKSLMSTNSIIRAYFCCGGTYGSCTHLNGFADRRVTAPPTRHVTSGKLL